MKYTFAWSDRITRSAALANSRFQSRLARKSDGKTIYSSSPNRDRERSPRTGDIPQNTFCPRSICAQISSSRSAANSIDRRCVRRLYWPQSARGLDGDCRFGKGPHMKTRSRILCSAAIASAFALNACDNTIAGSPAYISVSISPRPSTIPVGGTMLFTGTVSNNLSLPQWSLLDASEANNPGTLTPVSGSPNEILYTAPVVAAHLHPDANRDHPGHGHAGCHRDSSSGDLASRQPRYRLLRHYGPLGHGRPGARNRQRRPRAPPCNSSATRLAVSTTPSPGRSTGLPAALCQPPGPLMSAASTLRLPPCP